MAVTQVACPHPQVSTGRQVSAWRGWGWMGTGNVAVPVLPGAGSVRTEEGALGVRLLLSPISGIEFAGFSLCGSNALETRSQDHVSR